MITPENPGSEAAANLDLSHAGLVVPDSNEQRIMYASYGSNLHFNRFIGYITGGQVEGVAVQHEGSSDPTPPTAIVPLELPQGLYFAGESWHWLDDEGNKMGAGFTSLEDRPKGALGRGYNITETQFMDVVAQENGLPVGSLPKLDIDKVKDLGSFEMFPGEFYSTVQYNGEVEGIPVIGFTGPERPLNKPADGYLWAIGRGLMAAHDMREEQAAEYLAGAPGADISPVKLAHILAGDQPISKAIPKH